MYLIVTRRVDFKTSHFNKKCITHVLICDGNLTVYTNIKSCCTPETNTMFYVNYISIKKQTNSPFQLVCKDNFWMARSGNFDKTLTQEKVL